MDDLYMEAAERMLVGLETASVRGTSSVAHGVRVTWVGDECLYQSLGASIETITRERAVEILAQRKRDSEWLVGPNDTHHKGVTRTVRKGSGQ